MQLNHVESPPAEDVPIHFDHLEVALRHEPWDEYDDGRKPEVQEFMLMHTSRGENTTVVGFKHQDTRNYVFLHYVAHGFPRLTIPRTAEPFMKGEF